MFLILFNCTHFENQFEFDTIPLDFECSSSARDFSVIVLFCVLKFILVSGESSNSIHN